MPQLSSPRLTPGAVSLTFETSATLRPTESQDVAWSAAVTAGAPSSAIRPFPRLGKRPTGRQLTVLVRLSAPTYPSVFGLRLLAGACVVPLQLPWLCPGSCPPRVARCAVANLSLVIIEQRSPTVVSTWELKRRRPCQCKAESDKDGWAQLPRENFRRITSGVPGSLSMHRRPIIEPWRPIWYLLHTSVAHCIAFIHACAGRSCVGYWLWGLKGTWVVGPRSANQKPGTRA